MEDCKRNLEALRQKLTTSGLDGFIVPMSDPFQNEMVSSHFNRVHFLTNFTGSAGAVLVFKEKAILFTDGRYTTQAHEEVDTTLFEIQGHWLPSIHPFLKEDLRIGFDPWTLTAAHRDHLKTASVTWVSCAENPVDGIWDNRPSQPWAPLKVHGEGFAGESSFSKRQKIAQDLKAQGLDAFILTTGDSLAWLLNIRGGDVDRTPIPFCYGVIHRTGLVDFFVDPQKVSSTMKDFLGADIVLHPLEDLASFLRTLKRVGFDARTTPVAIFDVLQEGIAGKDPCLLPKACKNDVEQEGARQCHIVDGIALTKFLYFLYHHTYDDGFDEAQAVLKLQSFRALGKHYQGDSFETISAAGPHSAWCHYHTKPHTNIPLKKGDMYLVDSGGQYLNGTTDVTRTIILGGKATEQQKNHYTRVLKGHIALATIKFPKGTSGVRLDVLARQYLWEEGLDFPHGTGHGVGSYLSVHEGPQGITPRRVDAPLMPGMILSNEPGYYLEGDYGIRSENLMLVQECKDLKGFLEFENLTWAPFDPNLVDFDQLSLKEKQWLRVYHENVLKLLSPDLSEEERKWVEGLIGIFSS
jgi:Xaa-Pro aminopeptidase